MICTDLKSQDKPELYQLSGIVMNGQDGKAIPFANVAVKGTYRGISTDETGFYSLVVRPGDSVSVSVVGFKSKSYLVPDTLVGIRQSLHFMIYPDTVELDPVEVYPWPNQDELRNAMLALDVVSPEDQIAPEAGFRRIDNPTEPEPTVMNPASFFYDKVIVALKKKKRKRKKSKQLPKMN
jgi:hypothetical protein